ncbi:MAG: glycosyltransferase [Ferruginibacter sp.]|nr:glycosyltransferase [Ferruginibacter sp.]
MKKILIVTYYYEPYNIVASRRPKSWAEYLANHHQVTVLTRSWTGKENGIADITIENEERSIRRDRDNLEIINIPYLKVPYQKPDKIKNKGILKLKNYYKHFFGKYADIEFIEENFKFEILQTIKNKEIDLVIYTCNPYLFLPLSKAIYKKTKVRYILDFRDLLSATVLKQNLQFKEILYKKIMLIRLRRHIRYASCLITVSDPIKKILSEITAKETYVVYNGFDEEALPGILAKSESKEKFTLAYAGNLSPEMDIHTVLTGLTVFFKKSKPNAQVCFIGINENYKSIIKKYEDVQFVFSEWLPHIETLSLLRQSSVLLYMGWKGYTGIVSGKIFDYLGVQRTILLSPSDDDVLDNLISYTNAGYICNSSAEVCETVEVLYKEWEKNKEVFYRGEIKKIMAYTRNNQAKKLLEIINKAV